jgi:alpha-glucosidase
MALYQWGLLGAIATSFLATSFLATSFLASSISQTWSSTASSAFNTVTIGGVETAFRAIATLSPSIDDPQPILPNVQDPEAINAQTVCPGYKASQVERTEHGFTAALSLAGKPCNVYGTDVDYLSLTVEYQSADRLHVNISPTYLVCDCHAFLVYPPSDVLKFFRTPRTRRITFSMRALSLDHQWTRMPTWQHLSLT